MDGLHHVDYDQTLNVEMSIHHPSVPSQAFSAEWKIVYKYLTLPQDKGKNV